MTTLSLNACPIAARAPSAFAVIRPQATGTTLLRDCSAVAGLIAAPRSTGVLVCPLPVNHRAARAAGDVWLKSIAALAFARAGKSALGKGLLRL